MGGAPSGPAAWELFGLLHRTGLTTRGLTIDLSVSETGDMIHTDDEGSTSVTFRAGETTATLDVPTVDDTLTEDDSTITATIARNSLYYTIGTPGSATITANDNDPAPPTVNAAASPTTEGDIARRLWHLQIDELRDD